MDRVVIYNPETKAWFEQVTTGDIPEMRIYFCGAGARDDNVYNIIVYGGLSSGGGNAQDALGRIWVLTIPGFHWTRASTSAPPRILHKCLVAGGRQMISVGGLPAYHDAWKAAPMKDPGTQGFGVLDMKTLAWRASFDPSAGRYESPDVVKAWYAQGGLAKVKWQSDTLRDLFANIAVNSGGPGVTPEATPTPTTTFNGMSSSAGGGLSSSDKIALGCGIGVGLPAALAAVWTAWSGRHKRY